MKQYFSCLLMVFWSNLLFSQAFIDPKINSYKSEIPVVITLKEKADISRANQIHGKETKANFVYEKLFETSNRSQGHLKNYLNSHHIQYRSFYIVNMISAKLPKTLIDEIATMPEIESIIEDGKFEVEELAREDKPIHSRSIEWNLSKIKADSVWQFYTTGSNIIVGGQDTGYDWDHPALKAKYKGWDGNAANHNYHWHDAIHNSTNNPCGNDSQVPCDDNNHGTHTMGIMVGDDGAGNQIGVAPGARWIGCRNMDQGDGTLATYVECFEWFLAPYPLNGNTSQGDPSKSPHVINNSWGCPSSEGCNSTNFAVMEAALMALRTAGTVIVASNGNSGSSCASTNSPPAFFEGSFAVGSTTSIDTISNFSSRGPVTVDGSNRLKPDITAPGSNVRSCINGTTYASFSGTSMAGPHVAGLVALVIAANPQLAGEVDRIENIIKDSALPKITTDQSCGNLSGLEVPNNTFGYGRIDALKAVRKAVQTINVPFIKIDQFGYLPSAHKVAILTDPQSGYNSADSYTPSNTIKVKNAVTGAVVFTGIPIAWNSGATHSQSGDKVWWFDFSTVTTPGNYFIADGNLRSEEFKIHKNVYKDVHKITFNNFYHQRCGCSKLSGYVGSPYADATCHSQDLTCRFISDTNNVSFFKNMSGGWHDAGDYNKYVNFAYTAVIPLLSSFEFHPQAYNDSLNIPESYNGIPDLLDEVKYELDWLLKMQATDGGVHCIVGTKNYATASPPSADNASRFYGPKTTSASFSASAMLAFAAIEFKKINNTTAQSYATTLQTAAINAWNWGVANGSTTYYNSGIVAAGEQEVDAYERGMRKLAAAIYLYALTKDIVYKTHVESNYNNSHMMQWSYVYTFEPSTQLNLLYYANQLGINTTVGAIIKNTYKNSVLNSIDNFPSVKNKVDAYRSYLSDNNHVWGSNSWKTNMGNIYQTMNHYLLDNTKKDSLNLASRDYLHYIHGVNATGLCYLTNMRKYGAENSINTIYHGWFTDGNALWDDVRTSTYGPPSGILSGGVNPSWNLDNCCTSSCSTNINCITLTPPLNQPILKSYRDWNTGWPQNSWEITENAIYSQASYLFLLSAFVENASNYVILPVSSTVENANLSFTAVGKAIIIKSPNNSMFRISIDNSGSISTEVVSTLTGPNTKLTNNSLNMKQANSGLIIKSPNNSLWKISVDNGGNLTSISLGALTSPITKIESGDLVIESSQQGILFKDHDGICYYLSVDNGGKIFLRVVECE